MTNEQFIYWLKGFIDYQQLQEQKNPAFTRIKDQLNELNKVSIKNDNRTTAPWPSTDMNGTPIGVPNGTGLLNTGETGNSTLTYKTDVPVTYTTKQNSKATNSYI
jgi:hypothetical protein